MEPEEQQENVEDNVSPSVSSPSHSNNSETKHKKKMKRTRDLPNLTQCHSCGFRVDSCSGNDTLETLYSEWRVVLLCETCYIAVESSNLCSYCFKSGSSDEFFTCRQCKHIIHKTCYSDHADISPWSFCCSTTTRFSICLDCWVPKLVGYKSANCSSKRRNPVVFDLGNGRKRLLDFDGQSNDEAAGTRARELAVEKVLGARKAVLSDVELGNHMNGSVKILKDFCSVDSDPFVTTNGSCRTLEGSPAEALGFNGKNGILKDREGGQSNIIKYSRRNCGNGKLDRCRIKYTRKASVSASANTNQYLIKYARRTSTDQSFKGKPDRFAIKYTRRKLNQRPISV